MTRLFTPKAWTAIFAVAAVLVVLLPTLHLALPDTHPMHVSSFWITLLGKFMCYAVVALAIGTTPIAGCGASFYFGIGPDDDPPSISLAASPSSAAPGETIGLVAAAADDYRVVEVAFYRIDATGNTLLGRDDSAPYALETPLPAAAGGEVRYLAQAVDDAGQVTESPTVAVLVR